MEYGLIGEYLSHSYSGQIHAYLGDYRYECLELQPLQLASFLKQRAFRAINVTIPYKKSVLPYLDVLSPAAKRIGSVNTIVNKNGRLWGYNTDFAGMRMQIQRQVGFLKGKKGLVLGTGGTAQTAQAVAQSLGAETLTFVSHSGRAGAISYEEARKMHTQVQFLINTTPVGMYPHILETPLFLAPFSSLSYVFDAIYHPLRTRLILDAQEKQVCASGGLYMLVAQAVQASALFLDKPLDSSLVDDVYRKILSQKENIVLIGMPSCGKSTVGTLLHRMTGKRFLDTDKMVEKAMGLPIPEIFSRYGEKFFRQREKEAVHKASIQEGCIIATGGGAVLDEENVRCLKQTGRLFFLDRPLEKLRATKDRPLSENRDALARLAQVRLPLYRAVADQTIPAIASAGEVARKILEERCKVIF